ncbi:hypothetical protein MNAN1_000082 [Malassezia nana]|uniref:UBX domain-containing protein 1 n=1 Tax=Malassezia nana TaxID=180528 RepID=A0AAF0J0P1_9BASI|nr:hypothetical protein MNAN1_000082 [Malassezia nana]
MGFPEDRVDWALRSTSGGLTEALDHLEAHQEEPVPASENQASDAAPAQETIPKSIQCNVCTKVFRDMDLAMYHADKSGHEDFSESTQEIKPLTEEEKKAKLEELRAKAAKKRAAQEEQNAQDRRANEVLRRKAGQEASQAREELERKERIKEAERKRRERMEDLAAKERVRQQIEEDKRMRAEKAAMEKARREGAMATAPPPEQTPARPLKASTATETRLRVRAPGGVWMGTMSADATLSDVAEAVLRDGKAQGTLTFSTSFPRKTFTADECAKTLKELGLVPNAALEAS